MRGFVAIYVREVLSYFVTPLAWVMLASFLSVQGLHFFLLVQHFASVGDASTLSGPISAFFGQTVLIYLPLLFLCPLLTMRLFAEERRSGTIETLLTAPVMPLAVVLGKYFAAVTTYASLWAPTVIYVVIIGKLGRVDIGVACASYSAIMLIGAGYLAIGTMMSALTKSQLVAALLSAMALIGLFVLGTFSFVSSQSLLHDLAEHVSVWGHMNDFARGIIDSRRLVWDATLIALPLFITVKAVEAWRWG